MSLLVWLPLTKDLTNQGLSDATFSYVNNNGKLSLNASGKLGSCYERTASGYADLFRSSTTFNLSGDLSMCCWAYVSATIGDTANGVITNHNHADNTSVGITVKQVSTTDYRICCSTGTGSSRTFYTYYGTTNIKDAWHHLALTYTKSTKVLQLWVDGIVEYTLNNYANASGNNTFDLFNWSTGYGGNAQYRPVCKLNDVRLYDHCLSAKEVKEISKGLVCHYTLGDIGGGPNLYTGSHDFSGTWGNSASWTTDTETFSGFVVKKRTGSWAGLHQNITATLNDVFTISFYAKRESGANVMSIHRSSLGNVTTGLSILGGNFETGTTWLAADSSNLDWKYCWATVKITSADITYLQWRIENSVANKTMWITHLKVERGDKATPWIPNSADPEYTAMGYNDTTVYDSSGYNYHGTINTAMTVSSDTSRYSVSTHFNGTDNAITIPFNTMCPTNIFTMNIWFKKDSLGSKNYETLVGGPSGFEMDTRAGTATTMSLYMASTRGGSLYSPLEFGVWNMITMVRDGTNELYYVNGDLKKTITAKSMPTGTYFIGAWNSKTSQNYFGLMSDFRLYSTCLSAEDIKVLYQVGASIDKDGNMYAYEFNEV